MVRAAIPAKFTTEEYNIEFDAVIERTESYEAEIPQYPTEAGYEVADTIIFKPFMLTVLAYISDKPIAHVEIGDNKMEARKGLLLQLYRAKTPFKFTTAANSYDDMVIQSLTITKDNEHADSLEIDMTLVQITRTTQAVVYIENDDVPTGTISDNGVTEEAGDAERTNEETKKESGYLKVVSLINYFQRVVTMGFIGGTASYAAEQTIVKAKQNVIKTGANKLASIVKGWFNK